MDIFSLNDLSKSKAITSLTTVIIEGKQPLFVIRLLCTILWIEKAAACLLTKTSFFFVYVFASCFPCCRCSDACFSPVWFLSAFFSCVLSCHDKRTHFYHMILHFFLFPPYGLPPCAYPLLFRLYRYYQLFRKVI